MTVKPICCSMATTTSTANITELGTIWETEEKNKNLNRDWKSVVGWLLLTSDYCVRLQKKLSEMHKISLTF